MADSGLFSGLSGLGSMFGSKNYLTGLKDGKAYTTLNADELDPGSITGSISGGTGIDLGDSAQLGGFALGAYDDLLGTGGKAKKQQLSNMKKSSVLLDQQIANNTQSMADKKAFNQGMADASSKAMGLGTVYNYDKK